MFFGPNELRSGWRLLIFAGVVYALGWGSGRTIGRLLRGADSDSLFLVREITDFLIFLIASWIMGRIESRTIADYGLPWRKMFRGQFWQGTLIGIVSITVLLVVMRIAGVFYFGKVGLRGAGVVQWAIVWALVFILVALREEFRARGYALYTLATGIGFWPAAILSAAYFGYSHHGNTGEDLIGLFNAGAFGMLLAFLLRRTGDLWLPIGFHAAFDWGETYLYGVADSGNVTPGHLLNSSHQGPLWLSGGSVGPEGSVLCTLLIIAIWFTCAKCFRAARYPAPTRT